MDFIATHADEPQRHVCDWIGADEAPNQPFIKSSDLVFGATCPDAPGLKIAGAVFEGASLTGVAATRKEAVLKLTGEMAERRAMAHALLQYQRRMLTPPFTGFADADLTEDFQSPVWSDVFASGDGGSLSEGCAAHPLRSGAIIHGVRELIERDATALWWRGGRRGRRLNAPPALLQKYQDPSAGGRQITLLDISSCAQAPTVTAISCDENGRMFSSGQAAAGHTRAAAEKALIECHQMEVSHHLIRSKLSDGAVNLSPEEYSTIQRASIIDVPALIEEGSSSIAEWPVSADPCEADEAGLAAAIEQLGARVMILDLGQHEGLHVIKAWSPDLQPSGASRIRDRLAREIRKNAGGLRSACGLPLD